MRDIQKRRRFQNYAKSFLVVGVLCVVCVLVWRGVWGVYQKEARSRDALTQLEQEYQDHETRRDYLEARVEALQTEEGVTTEMREKFDVLKEGEQVVVVVDPQFQEDETSQEDVSWWGWLRNIFQRMWQ